MGQQSWLHAALLSTVCGGLMFIFCTSIASPAVSNAIAPVRTAKCTIDIAAGNETDCTLIKANHEWILWSNTSAKPRSVHFNSGENPFTEKRCWDVAPGARDRSGPVALNAAPKTYVAHTSDVPCDSNPPSNTGRSSPKVTIQ